MVLELLIYAKSAMKNFATKLLCFKSLENFVLKIVHCGHNLGAHMKKIG